MESTHVDANPRSPRRYQNYVEKFGDNPVSVALTLGWSRDSRDNSLAPTRGVYQRLSGELGLPGLDIQYYKATYQYQHYIPLSRTWTLALNGEVGWGDVYGSTDQFPFFKNFYVGGIGSVRGYDSGTLGPKDYSANSDGYNLGGDRMITGNIEILAPLRAATARCESSASWMPATRGVTKVISTATTLVRRSTLLICAIRRASALPGFRPWARSSSPLHSRSMTRKATILSASNSRSVRVSKPFPFVG